MIIQKSKTFLLPLLTFKNLTTYHWLFLFGAFAFLNVPALFNDDCNSNLSVMLGDAFIHGHLYVSHFFMDVSEYGGKYFSPFPPFPALIAIPFIGLFGATHVNSVAICVLLSFVNIYSLIQIIRKIDVAEEYRFWIFIGFIFGTGYWYTMITSHHVSGFAHIISTTLLLLSILELLGKKRVWLLAILIGCSFLSRQMTLFHSIFFVLYFFLFSEGNDKYKKPVLFCISLLPFVLIYMLYNYLRFNNPFDTGYAYLDFIPVFKSRIEHHGLFNFYYVPYNAYNLFIKGPNIIFQEINLQHIADMDRYGTSLTLASPFLLVALKSNCDNRLKISAWASILVVMIGVLLYFNNGFEQINTQRFSLDFIPLLMLLMCYGCSSIPSWLFRNLVIYAVLLNIFSFVIHALYQ